MSIVASDRDELAIAAGYCLIPTIKTVSWTREEVREHQIMIRTIRPQSIKERDNPIHRTRVCEQVVNLNPIDGRRLPVLRFRWVCIESQSAIRLLLIDYLLRWLCVH